MHESITVPLNLLISLDFRSIRKFYRLNFLVFDFAFEISSFLSVCGELFRSFSVVLWPRESVAKNQMYPS